MYRKDKTKRIDRLIKRIESGERNIVILMGEIFEIEFVKNIIVLEIQGYSEGYDS